MRRGIKIFWIVIGSIFALGLALAIIGFALGASGRAWLDSTGMHFGNQETTTSVLADSASDSFRNIDVTLIEADVEIIVASDYGYEFTYRGSNVPEVSVSNGTLKVVEKSVINNWTLNIFGSWNFFETSSRLKVFVPADAALDVVSISTASGATVLNNRQIEIRKLVCQSASGDVRLSDLSLEQLNLDVASGDIEMHNVSANDVRITMMSGSLTANAVKYRNLKLDLASCDIDIQGEISDQLNINMLSGNVKIRLTGNPDDYSYEVTNLSGDVRINGRSMGFGTGIFETSSGRSSYIVINTTSGDVDISFK